MPSRDGPKGQTAMPYGAGSAARRPDPAKLNRFLTTLAPQDYALLAPHLRTVTLDPGGTLHEAGEEIEHVYFPHSGMVSLVAVMSSGATVETATVGRSGVIGATVGFGSRQAFGRAIVQLPGLAARIPRAEFHAAANASAAIRDLVVGYNDLLISQIQQSVACNA